jgi:DNA-binding transcriptional ArsR family regulator
MSQSYTNQVIGVISTHSKISQNQHKFYKSSMDLLGLLLWFQHRSDGCYASTSWLANKLSVSERAILKTLKLLEQAGLIHRSREGRRRVITCLIDRLPRPKSKSKSTPIKRQKVHTSKSLYIEQKLHNTNADVDVVVDVLKKEGMKPMVALSLVKRYPKQRIREVINASRKQAEISNKPGWIVKALAADWTIDAGRPIEPPRYQVFKRPSEPVDRSGYVAGIQMIRARIGMLSR